MVVSRRFLLILTVALALAVVCTRAEEKQSSSSTGGLRSEEDVSKIREEELAKLEKPLEKMKVKELKQILTDRGVVCTACSEKEQLIKTVRESIHLPIKKDHLKKMKMPNKPDDDEVNEILKMMKKQREEEQKIKDILKEKGFDGKIQFGGDPMKDEKIDKLFNKKTGDKEL